MGRWLAGLYPWRPIDAVWFLLTGQPPEVVGVELSYHHQRNLFTLVFAPWVSEKTTRLAFDRARSHLGESDPGPLFAKTVSVLRFAADQTEKHGRRPSWEELRELWNDLHSDKRYGFSRQGLRQGYRRAEGRLWRLLCCSGRRGF